MIKYNLTNSMIGNYYPFFLSNEVLPDAYYLYAISSPSLSPDVVPYLSLKKISEKTRPSDYTGNDSDILATILGYRKDIANRGVDLLKDVLRKDNPVIDKNGYGFPLIEMESGNNIQKSLIIGLRDSLRWKVYNFSPGCFVDILWTPTQFMLFRILGEKRKKDGEEEIWLEPVGLYNNTDVELKNPISPLDLSKIDYPYDRWSGIAKASTLNRALKKLEWESFSRAVI